MSELLPKGRAGHRIAILLVRVGVTLTLGLGVAITSPAQTPPSRDLTQFTLEDLMNVQVISVSKKEQKLAKTGAAIFGITQEDIRRSGATSIPDLLNLLQPRRAEFPDIDFINHMQDQRSVFGKITWRF